MTDAKTRPPLLRATVDIDWEVRGRKYRLTPEDEPTRDVPAKVSGWCIRCGALEVVEEAGDDR